MLQLPYTRIDLHKTAFASLGKICKATNQFKHLELYFKTIIDNHPISAYYYFTCEPILWLHIIFFCMCLFLHYLNVFSVKL